MTRALSTLLLASLLSVACASGVSSAPESPLDHCDATQAACIDSGDAFGFCASCEEPDPGSNKCVVAAERCCESFFALCSAK
jgi:hypothetical protein